MALQGRRKVSEVVRPTKAAHAQKAYTEAPLCKTLRAVYSSYVYQTVFYIRTLSRMDLYGVYMRGSRELIQLPLTNRVAACSPKMLSIAQVPA